LVHYSPMSQQLKVLETTASEEIINDTVSFIRSTLNVFGLDDFDNMNRSNDGKEKELLKVIQRYRD